VYTVFDVQYPHNIYANKTATQPRKIWAVLAGLDQRGTVHGVCSSTGLTRGAPPKYPSQETPRASRPTLVTVQRFCLPATC